jgi:hypothetical protein
MRSGYLAISTISRAHRTSTTTAPLREARWRCPLPQRARRRHSSRFRAGFRQARPAERPASGDPGESWPWCRIRRTRWRRERRGSRDNRVDGGRQAIRLPVPGTLCGCVSRRPRCFSSLVRWPPCSSEYCFGPPNASASQIATFLACSFVKEANTSASAGSAPPCGQVVALIRGIVTAVRQDVHQLAEWIAHKESTDCPGLVSRSVLDRDLCGS